jgi:hypothetical protein
MGRLLQDLSTKMQHKADKPAAEPLRIAVHSTHDTGIAALAATLGVFDDKFVPPPPSAPMLRADRTAAAQVARVYFCDYLRAVPPFSRGGQRGRGRGCRRHAAEVCAKRQARRARRSRPRERVCGALYVRCCLWAL